MGLFLWQIRKRRTLFFGLAENAKQKNVQLELLQMAYMLQVGVVSTIISSGHFMKERNIKAKISKSVIFAIKSSK